MRIPILVTMSWPERLPCSDEFCPRLDFVKMGDLTFKAPDNAKYPAMQLAYSAGRAGGTMTGVLSAANEQACNLLSSLSNLLLQISMTNVELTHCCICAISISPCTGGKANTCQCFTLCTCAQCSLQFLAFNACNVVKVFMPSFNGLVLTDA